MGVDVQQDRGYAWIVLAAGFTFNVLISIQFAAVGVFMVEFRHYFNTSRAMVAWIGSTTVTVGSFFAFPLSFLVKRLGTRVMGFAGTTLVAGGYLLAGVFPSIPMLFVGYGFIPSIGLSVQMLVSFVSLQKYFDKRRKQASGIFMSGISFGILVWPIVAERLIQMYSWTGAMIILGGVQLNGFVCSALLRPIDIQPKRTLHVEKTKESLKGQENGMAVTTIVKSHMKDHWALRWVPFGIFCVGVVMIYAGHQVIHAYIPMRAESLQMSKYQGAFLVSLIGITGLPARPLCGMIGGHQQVTKFSTLMFGGAAICGGILNLLILGISSYIPLAFVTGCFGVAAAGYIGIATAIIVDIIGVENAEIGTGLFILSTAVAYLLMHLLSGWLMDFTQNTATPFIVFGAAQIMGGILVALIPLVILLLKKKCPSLHDNICEIELKHLDKATEA